MPVSHVHEQLERAAVDVVNRAIAELQEGRAAIDELFESISSRSKQDLCDLLTRLSLDLSRNTGRLQAVTEMLGWSSSYNDRT